MRIDRLIVPCLALAVVAAVWSPILNATAPSSAIAEPRIATVDTLSLLEAGLQAPEYTELRESMGREFQTRLEAESNEILSMNAELQTLQPGDPRGEALFGQIQQRRQSLATMQQELMQEFEAVNASHAAEVYEKIRGATAEVASREGYTHVFSKREGTALADSTSLTQVTQEVLARPAIVSPEGDDLTEAVRTSLGFPENVERDLLDADSEGMNEPAQP